MLTPAVNLARSLQIGAPDASGETRPLDVARSAAEYCASGPSTRRGRERGSPIWLGLVMSLLLAYPALGAHSERGLLAEGPMRVGGTWQIGASAHQHENTMCWEGTTEKANPVVPPLSLPNAVTVAAQARCAVRPRPYRLGKLIVIRRCDADTTLVTGAIGAAIKRVELRVDKVRRASSIIVFRPKHHALGRGFFALLESRPLELKVSALDARGRRRATVSPRWPDCVPTGPGN